MLPKDVPPPRMPPGWFPHHNPIAREPMACLILHRVPVVAIRTTKLNRMHAVELYLPVRYREVWNALLVRHSVISAFRALDRLLKAHTPEALDLLSRDVQGLHGALWPALDALDPC